MTVASSESYYTQAYYKLSISSNNIIIEQSYFPTTMLLLRHSEDIAWRTAA